MTNYKLQISNYKTWGHKLLGKRLLGYRAFGIIQPRGLGNSKRLAFGIIQRMRLGNSALAFGIIQPRGLGNSALAFGIIVWRAICRGSNKIFGAMSNISSMRFDFGKSWRSRDTSHAFGIIQQRVVYDYSAVRLLITALFQALKPSWAGDSKRLAFGIIEVLISGVLVITVIGATVSVRQTSNTQASLSRHQQTAQMLAQEGMEAVRQIRDTNYLAKQKPTQADPYVKRPWTCDLTTKPQLAGGAALGYYEFCNTSPLNIRYTTNYGDFSYATVPTSLTHFKSLELGVGMMHGGIFRDDAALVPTVDPTKVGLPTWHLSAPQNSIITSSQIPAVYDGGGQNLASASAVADNCVGAERIFVRDGTTPIALPYGTTDLVLENWRKPGSTAKDSQKNFIKPPAGVTPDCVTLIPSGFFEYKRQVIVSNGGPTDEGPGNLPATWSAADPITNHMVRVLVRVSWKENNRNSVTADEQAVLLSTYLTDWRPSN